MTGNNKSSKSPWILLKNIVIWTVLALLFGGESSTAASIGFNDLVKGPMGVEDMYQTDDEAGRRIFELLEIEKRRHGLLENQDFSTPAGHLMIIHGVPATPSLHQVGFAHTNPENSVDKAFGANTHEQMQQIQPEYRQSTWPATSISPTYFNLLPTGNNNHLMSATGTGIQDSVTSGSEINIALNNGLVNSRLNYVPAEIPLHGSPGGFRPEIANIHEISISSPSPKIMIDLGNNGGWSSTVKNSHYTEVAPRHHATSNQRLTDFERQNDSDSTEYNMKENFLNILRTSQQLRTGPQDNSQKQNSGNKSDKLVTLSFRPFVTKSTKPEFNDWKSSTSSYTINSDSNKTIIDSKDKKNYADILNYLSNEGGWTMAERKGTRAEDDVWRNTPSNPFEKRMAQLKENHSAIKLPRGNFLENVEVWPASDRYSYMDEKLNEKSTKPEFKEWKSSTSSYRINTDTNENIIDSNDNKNYSDFKNDLSNQGGRTMAERKGTRTEDEIWKNTPSNPFEQLKENYYHSTIKLPRGNFQKSTEVRPISDRYSNIDEKLNEKSTKPEFNDWKSSTSSYTINSDSNKNIIDSKDKKSYSDILNDLSNQERRAMAERQVTRTEDDIWKNTPSNPFEQRMSQLKENYYYSATKLPRGNFQETAELRPISDRYSYIDEKLKEKSEKIPKHNRILEKQRSLGKNIENAYDQLRSTQSNGGKYNDEIRKIYYLTRERTGDSNDEVRGRPVFEGFSAYEDREAGLEDEVNTFFGNGDTYFEHERGNRVQRDISSQLNVTNDKGKDQENCQIKDESTTLSSLNIGEQENHNVTLLDQAPKSEIKIRNEETSDSPPGVNTTPINLIDVNALLETINLKTKNENKLVTSSQTQDVNENGNVNNKYKEEITLTPGMEQNPSRVIPILFCSTKNKAPLRLSRVIRDCDESQPEKPVEEMNTLIDEDTPKIEVAETENLTTDNPILPLAENIPVDRNNEKLVDEAINKYLSQKLKEENSEQDETEINDKQIIGQESEEKNKTAEFETKMTDSFAANEVDSTKEEILSNESSEEKENEGTELLTEITGEGIPNNVVCGLIVTEKMNENKTEIKIEPTLLLLSKKFSKKLPGQHEDIINDDSPGVTDVPEESTLINPATEAEKIVQKAINLMSTNSEGVAPENGVEENMEEIIQLNPVKTVEMSKISEPNLNIPVGQKDQIKYQMDEKSVNIADSTNNTVDKLSVEEDEDQVTITEPTTNTVDENVKQMQNRINEKIFQTGIPNTTEHPQYMMGEKETHSDKNCSRDLTNSSLENEGCTEKLANFIANIEQGILNGKRNFTQAAEATTIVPGTSRN